MTTKREVMMNRKWASQLGVLAQTRELGPHAVLVEVDTKDWAAFAAELARWGTVALETISSLDGVHPLYTVIYVDGADHHELAALAARVGTEAHDQHLHGICGDLSVSGGCARPPHHRDGHSMYPILDDPGATPIPELLEKLDAGRPRSGDPQVRIHADAGTRMRPSLADLHQIEAQLTSDTLTDDELADALRDAGLPELARVVEGLAGRAFGEW